MGNDCTCFYDHVDCHLKKNQKITLSNGTSETINFPFGTNGKLMVFRRPSI